jgi:uncharacterized protein
MIEPAATRAAACAICGKPVEQKFKPFCSKRCADLDLHRWLSGRYAVPVRDDEDGAPETGATGLPERQK